ncbi:hypothetical protein CsSME_00053071 [Camellia sinensis var. sinensis]
MAAQQCLERENKVPARAQPLSLERFVKCENFWELAFLAQANSWSLGRKCKITVGSLKCRLCRSSGSAESEISRLHSQAPNSNFN